jgi:hypothetical protein
MCHSERVAKESDGCSPHDPCLVGHDIVLRERNSTAILTTIAVPTIQAYLIPERCKLHIAKSTDAPGRQEHDGNKNIFSGKMASS